MTPLSITSPAPETLHIVLDAAIAKADKVALHAFSSASTVLLSGQEVDEFVKALKKDGEVKVVDFEELKAAQAQAQAQEGEKKEGGAKEKKAA